MFITEFRPAARRTAKRSTIIIETEPHVCIEIGTHATLFLWSKWLAAWITGACAQRDDDDDVAQHGGHPANTKSCSLGLHHISLILDMHIMLNWQLSYQEIRWPISRDHIAGSGLELIKVACFLKLTAYWVLVFVRIAGSCQVNLLKTGLFGSQLTLTMVWNLTKLYLFLLYKCLLLLCFVYMVIIKTQTGGQTIYRKPHRKVKKLKSKLNIFLG